MVGVRSAQFPIARSVDREAVIYVLSTSILRTINVSPALIRTANIVLKSHMNASPV